MHGICTIVLLMFGVLLYLNINNIQIRHTWVAFCTGWGVPALHAVATPCSRPVTIVVIIVTLTGISTYMQKNQS